MDKSLKSIASLALMGAVASTTSCKKYEDDQGIQLKPVKKRIQGQWELKSLNGVPLGSSTSEILWEFQEDGDFVQTTNYDYGTYSYTYSYLGSWEWEKGKEGMEIILDKDTFDFDISKLSDDQLNGEWKYDNELYLVSFERVE